MVSWRQNHSDPHHSLHRAARGSNGGVTGVYLSACVKRALVVGFRNPLNKQIIYLHWLHFIISSFFFIVHTFVMTSAIPFSHFSVYSLICSPYLSTPPPHHINALSSFHQALPFLPFPWSPLSCRLSSFLPPLSRLSFLQLSSIFSSFSPPVRCISPSKREQRNWIRHIYVPLPFCLSSFQYVSSFT